MNITTEADVYQNLLIPMFEGWRASLADDPALYDTVRAMYADSAGVDPDDPAALMAAAYIAGFSSAFLLRDTFGGNNNDRTAN